MAKKEEQRAHIVHQEPAEVLRGGVPRAWPATTRGRARGHYTVRGRTWTKLKKNCAICICVRCFPHQSWDEVLTQDAHSYLADERRNQVVRVHDNVYEGVLRRGKVCVATRRIVGDHPPDEGDGSVVVHVQEGHLLHVALVEHDHRVEKLIYLGPEEGEDHLRHLRLRGAVRVAPDRIAVLPSLVEHAREHVCTKEHKEEVVDYGERLEHGAHGLL
eukprot:scaffold266_cov391-Prasinococcus_capsulatus_cf.AAC.4